jgi:hypothetical protein
VSVLRTERIVPSGGGSSLLVVDLTSFVSQFLSDWFWPLNNSLKKVLPVRPLLKNPSMRNKSPE